MWPDVKDSLKDIIQPYERYFSQPHYPIDISKVFGLNRKIPHCGILPAKANQKYYHWVLPTQ